ncbi:RNA polymerase-associated factor [Modicella reniformis]|uniref:RNA polymerase-associated factor n=1 Tax=Modicella reniformis TaxID=1440133 RepID=A0A9P6IW17_9FUNG|nr:RNA polymerase-associated factor [Modicella reniformis]
MGSGKGAFKESSSSLRRKNMVVDNSREGQIAAIQKTFERFIKKSSSTSPELRGEKEFLTSLRHPTKPELTAVDSIPVFPDFATWGNAYTHMTFDVDPEISNKRSSREREEGRTQRSSNALIKPMSEAGNPETWLSYYLPDMETAKRINHRKRSRAQRAASGLSARDHHDDDDDDDDDDDEDDMVFTLQRDYTYTTLKCDALSTLVFTLRDIPETKQKAAFYNPMQSRLMLRKKRAKRYEDDDPPITHIDAKTRRMNSVELVAKREALQAIDC